MAISVEVLPSCTVAASPIVLQTGAGLRVTAASDIQVRCSPDQPFTVTLDRGQNAAGSVRRALEPTARHYLAYEIYRDPHLAQSWASAPTESPAMTTDSSGLALLKAYGVFLPGQDLRPGRYQDQVVLTVNF